MVLSLMPGVPLVAKAAGTEGMITIEMTDSYDDGWDSNAIDIYADGELLDTAALGYWVASGTWTMQINYHVTYTFKWVTGTYPEETRFVIYAGTEQKLSASGGNYSTGDVLLTVEATCTEPVYETGVCTKCGIGCVHQMNSVGSLKTVALSAAPMLRMTGIWVSVRFAPFPVSIRAGQILSATPAPSPAASM